MVECGRPSVLLVDRPGAGRDALSSLLQIGGWGVGLAADPEEAWQEVGRFDWDAAVIDPDPAVPWWADGLRRIRTSRPALPILLATAFAAHEIEIAPLVALATRVMVKPVDAREMAAVLRALVAAAR